MHHPPENATWFTTLRGDLHDAEAFWEVVAASNVDLVVCGHEHARRSFRRNGVPVICVGGFMADDSRALLGDAGSGRLQWSWWNAWS